MDFPRNIVARDQATPDELKHGKIYSSYSAPVEIVAGDERKQNTKRIEGLYVVQKNGHSGTLHVIMGKCPMGTGPFQERRDAEKAEAWIIHAWLTVKTRVFPEWRKSHPLYGAVILLPAGTEDPESLERVQGVYAHFLRARTADPC